MSETRTVRGPRTVIVVIGLGILLVLVSVRVGFEFLQSPLRVIHGELQKAALVPVALPGGGFGLHVTSVAADPGVFAASGIRPGDVILAVDGASLASPDVVAPALFHGIGEGRPVPLRVRRGEDVLDLVLPAAGP